MDRFKVVQQGLPRHARALEGRDPRALPAKKIRPTTPRYHWIDTLYALSEATMYAGIVDAFEKRGLAVDYARLFTDIRECIDEAHRDGTILDAVIAQSAALRRCAIRTSRQTLHKLRSAGQEALPAHQLALALHRAR